MKGRKRTASSDRTRYIPGRTLDIDKVLNKEELEYFWKTYCKGGITTIERDKLGHMAMGGNGREHLFPPHNQRYTIRETVGEFILRLRLQKNDEQPEELYFFDSALVGAKLDLQHPLYLTPNNLEKIPVFLAYRDALAKEKGKNTISPSALSLKNEEMNLSLYEGKRK